MGEGEVMEIISTEIQTRTSVYDGFVNDTDSIGGHQRGDYIYPISTLLDSSPTLPTLDLDDFIGLSFGTGSDGVVYQMPDQQFANLYWFRYDWFSDPEIQAQFEEIYGYPLGVPVNWSAYEDIAVFFSTQVNGDGTIDGEKVYGHMDYGAKHFSLGWRFTDAWLSMAGNGDTVFHPETGDRTPNGIPVDEWGIRVENCSPVGSSVTRGGDTNAPASVYAVQKYLDWFEFAPPGSQNINFDESATVVGEGATAQQMFWYTVFTRATIDSPAMTDADGNAVWRMAPSPHGAYWKEGHKLGYQDAGSWTFMNHADPEKRDAAWLYAQFVTSKTVDVAKSIQGLTFIRDSTINHQFFTDNAADYGGLVEFYRSPDRVNWTPTGTNVPDYPSMSALWWQAIGSAAAGEVTAQEAMDQLAAGQDEIMQRLEAAGVHSECGVKLNEERDAQYWLDQPGAPYPKLANEKPAAKTQTYDDIVAAWFRGESVIQE
jgi:glycerol transport system substrate-binding protein